MVSPTYIEITHITILSILDCFPRNFNVFHLFFGALLCHSLLVGLCGQPGFLKSSSPLSLDGLPSGKHTQNDGKSQCLMGNSTINGHVQ